MRRSGIGLVDGVGIVGGFFVVVDGFSVGRRRTCLTALPFLQCIDDQQHTPNTLAPMQTQATNSLLVMTANTSAARPITARTSEIISTG